MFRKHRLPWNAWNTSPVGTVLKGLSQFAFAFKRSSEVQTLVMRKLNEIQTTQPQASIFLLLSRNCRMLRTRSSRWFRGQPFPKKCLKESNIQGQTSGERTVTHENKAMKKASSLYQLDPFLDASGVLRVGGRIKRSSLSYGAKHPIILPRKGHMTELIICHHHQLVKHQGREITHNEIRSAGYWMIGGGSAVSNHIAKCVKCRKLREIPQEQKMADLPEDRLEPAPTFTSSAVEYFVPWYVKDGRRELKRY